MATRRAADPFAFATAFLALVAALGHLKTARSLENGLARTPPMGWLAWARFTCTTDCESYPNECINALLFKQMAHRLVADGWLELGYQYVNVDDCWSTLTRDHATGQLVPDGERFPGGIGELAHSLHERDPRLKLGLYGDCGTHTCAGYPGQLKQNYTLNYERATEKDWRTTTHFELDAKTLADWQVDSFKFDGCHVNPFKAERLCAKMATALAETRRPILLVCEWPFYMMYTHTEPDFELTGAACNVWRYYDDIEDSWLSVLNTIDYTVRHQSTIVKYHGPGHWFDPDQLMVGNFGLSLAQARAQMALWSIWSAPLYMSNDLRALDAQMAAVLKNKHLIAVDQDRLGVFGLMVAQSADGLLQAFAKPMLPVRRGCPSFALVYLNRHTLGGARKVSFALADLLLAAPIRQAAKNQARVHEYESATRLDIEDAFGPETKDNELTESAAELDELLYDKVEAGTGAAETEATTSSTSSSSFVNAERDDTDHLIKPVECLRRLRSAAQFHAAGESPASNPEAPLATAWVAPTEASNFVQFELSDLFADGESLGVLGVHEQLELLVEPSSVRALKLVELDQ